MSWLDNANETKEDHQTQGSSAWLAWRMKHIGASEVSAILGESDFQTAEDVWKVKTGRKEGFRGNWATQRGTDAEPRIRALYEELYKVKLTTPVMEYAPWTVLSASLDGLSKEMGLVVEIKYPSKEKHAMALKGEVPPTYRAQIQTQMLVAGAAYAHYVSYDGVDIAVVVVQQDVGEQQRILAACKEFWKCVESDTPPRGSTVILESDTLETLAVRFKSLNRIADDTEREIKLIRQKLDELVEEDKAKFYGLTLTRSERAGAVDYAKVPELKHVNLESYRRSPSKVLTIKIDE